MSARDPGIACRAPGRRATRAVTVLPDRSAPPSTKLYDQKIPASGYGYLTTRDGTTMAIDVHLPGRPGARTRRVVEYSGLRLRRSRRRGQRHRAGRHAARIRGRRREHARDRLLGRGVHYFETLQNLDGYDVIETVAHQPWVLHHKVGMIGISYGGFSQLFVAATDPPDLAAIAPLSDIDNSATTLYPGGILNTGFGVP